MPQGKLVSKAIWQTAYLIPKPRIAIFPWCPISHVSRLSLHPQRVPPRPSRRTFITTTPLLKKGGKENNKHNGEDPASPGAAPDDVDPFDTSQLEDGIRRTIERLKDDLSKLRAGGRFNLETLEKLRVQLSKKSPTTEKLSDLAQIVPKGGRAVIVMVGEEDHVKAVMSAIHNAGLSLTPQLADPKEPTHVLVPIPPPTRESRLEAVTTATRAGEQAGVALRNVRAAHQKKLRAWQLARTVRPDDLRKAGELMEKVVERGVDEVKKVVDGAKKVLTSG